MSRGGVTVIERSFLRRADPRTKLALSLAASLAVMLPLAQVLVVFIAYVLLIAAARVLPRVLVQIRRLSPLLAVLFALDWLFIGAEFAVVITLRLILLVTSFTLLLATTTVDELRLAFEGVGMSRRLAFTFATLCRSLDLTRSEWLGVMEAQRARGIMPPTQRPAWRTLGRNLKDFVTLVVPAVVLMAQRAWSITEAASARGLETPVQSPPRTLRLAWLDGILLSVMGGLLVGLYAFR